MIASGVPPLSMRDVEGIFAALADAVVDEYLPTGTLTVRVGHGLPDVDFPLAQPQLGEWWRQRVEESKRDSVAAGIWSVATGEQDSWMDEYTFCWNDRLSVHVVHRVIALCDSAGTPQRLIHIFHDATVRRRAEQQLDTERRDLERLINERTHALTLKNAELARAMRHKDDFLASMSHELRTPLNAVIGLTDALLEGIGGPLSERQRSWLGDIASSGKHLLGLINDILDLARVASGRVDPDLQTVDPREVADGAQRLVAGAALARGVRMDTEIAPDLAPFTSDPRLLRQILLNLLGNAVKFTPKGGAVMFRVRRDDAHVVFEVQDTGIGIPAERRADIFQPFLQIDQGLDRENGGTGLGLALVSRMSELLGGAVQVESTPGQGSTFTVRLPSLGAPRRDSGEVAGPLTEFPSVSASSALSVLLAEDNPANVRTFSEYLSAKGMKVHVVGDGEAAVAAVATQRIDIILMDIQMPKMDGLQATRLIRSEARLRRVPIVALTALAMPGDRERCLEAGANAYLAKPVRLRELAATIQALVLQAEA